MEIAVIGNKEQLDEVKAKFGSENTYALVDSNDTNNLSKNGAVIFAFELGQDLLSNVNVPLFVEASQMSLSKRLKDVSNIPKHIFGFCGLPTFFNRPSLEVSVHQDDDIPPLKEILHALKTDYQIVADHCGLVTPRVICMIINEAYYTTEEGTASRADIDLAMKLGTNYPWGPFEWCKRIGPARAVALLDAVYRDTGDERYLVCELLRREARS